MSDKIKKIIREELILKGFFLSENYDSKNLFDKISILSESFKNQVRDGFDWVNQNCPNCILIGGTAVVHYLQGGRDLTPDVDFLVSDTNSIKKMLDRDGHKYSPLLGTNGESIGITAPLFNMDFLSKGSGKFDDIILANSNKKIKVGGIEVRVVEPEFLAIMKLGNGRDKDLDDAFALLQSGSVDKSTYLNYLEKCKNVLDRDDYDTFLGYAEIIK